LGQIVLRGGINQQFLARFLERLSIRKDERRDEAVNNDTGNRFGL